MSTYEKPMILSNEEMSEGVFAGSGSCYTFTARIVQTPQLGNEVYTIQIDGRHEAADGHHSQERTIVLEFNQPVTYNKSNASAVSGDGTSSLTLTFTDGCNGSYHNNAIDNIGLGQLTVESNAGLAINSCYCIDCNEACNQGHSW